LNGNCFSDVLMHDAIIQHEPIPSELIAPLTERTFDAGQAGELGQAFAEDGYVLLRGALDRDDVLAAREEVFGRLHAVREIASPPGDGIATGESQRAEVETDLGEFWRSVSGGSALRNVSHGSRLAEIMSTLFDEPACPHDLIYLRPATVGSATRLHYDFPFFARNAPRIDTAWIPLGDVPVSDGPLVIIEGSQHFHDLIDPIRSIDYASDSADALVQQSAYDGQNALAPLTLVRGRGVRFLTTNFKAGDVMVFSGFTMHGSLDNHSPLGRVRLSTDVRYQTVAAGTDDERYFGRNPTGSAGGGYGAMRGAKPLTEPW